MGVPARFNVKCCVSGVAYAEGQTEILDDADFKTLSGMKRLGVPYVEQCAISELSEDKRPVEKEAPSKATKSAAAKAKAKTAAKAKKAAQPEKVAPETATTNEC
tara:strand:+ start:306 stop:617 length:312 start_codon:yes stop_codon:yes gene_type:complete